MEGTWGPRSGGGWGPRNGGGGAHGVEGAWGPRSGGEGGAHGAEKSRVPRDGGSGGQGAEGVGPMNRGSVVHGRRVELHLDDFEEVQLLRRPRQEVLREHGDEVEDERLESQDLFQEVVEPPVERQPEGVPPRTPCLPKEADPGPFPGRSRCRRGRGRCVSRPNVQGRGVL